MFTMKRVLVPNSEGGDVKRLQKRLNVEYPLKRIRVTGKYDAATKILVLKYQKDNNLLEDGVTGVFTHADLYDESFRFSKQQPPYIKQSILQCWAAAMEAWLSVTQNRKKYTHKQLIELYHRKGLLNKNGGLELTPTGIAALAAGSKNRGFHQLLNDFRMAASDKAATKPKNLKIEDIYSILRSKGHVVFFYKVGSGMDHAVVVYGVRRRQRSHPTFEVMDPLSGYKALPLFSMQQQPILYLWAR